MGRQYKTGDNIEIIRWSLGISPRKNCIFLRYFDIEDRCLVFNKDSDNLIYCWVILLDDIKLCSAQTNTFSDAEREAANNMSMLYYDDIEEFEDGDLYAYYHFPYCDQYIMAEAINCGLHNMDEIKRFIELTEKEDFGKRINLYVVHE